MGRTILAAVIASTCLLPSLSHAQTSRSAGPAVTHGTSGASRGGSFGPGMRHDPPPQPGRPAPPPPAGPLVPPAPPSALDSVDVFRAGPRTYAPRYNNSSRRGSYGGYGSGYGYSDPFGYISQPYSRQTDDSLRESDGTGYLRIEVEPDTARVYVDGLYAGTVGDFRRAGRALNAGPHRVEVKTDGFEPLTFDVRIPANDMVSYRGTLARVEQRAELRPPAAPKTFYVIPRCYAGDVRPRADQLPPGCQLARIREVPPVKAPSPR